VLWGVKKKEMGAENLGGKKTTSLKKVLKNGGGGEGERNSMVSALKDPGFGWGKKWGRGWGKKKEHKKLH